MGVAARPLFFAVDDEPQAQRWYARLLEEYGDVVVAPSAASARLQLAKRPEVSAALFDVWLPDGSGVTVCREIRSRMPEVACLMLTSFGDDEALFDAIMAGEIVDPPPPNFEKLGE